MQVSVIPLLHFQPIFLQAESTTKSKTLYTHTQKKTAHKPNLLSLIHNRKVLLFCLLFFKMWKQISSEEKRVVCVYVSTFQAHNVHLCIDEHVYFYFYAL